MHPLGVTTKQRKMEAASEKLAVAAINLKRYQTLAYDAAKECALRSRLLAKAERTYQDALMVWRTYAL